MRFIPPQRKMHVKSISNMYFQTYGRAPLDREIHEADMYLVSHTLDELYSKIFEEHIKKVNQRFRFLGTRDHEHADADASNVQESASSEPLDIKTKSMLIVSLVKDVSATLDNVKALVNDLKPFFRKVCFFFYHNNSSDNSEALLKEWRKNDIGYVNGIFAPSTSITVIDPSTRSIGNRIPKFARMRNESIKIGFEHFGKDFDYVLMANTDLVSPVDVSGIIKSLTCFQNEQNKQDWSIICGNCCFKKSFFHYDAYALRLEGESRDIREVYKSFDRYYGLNSHWLDKLHVFDGWTKVHSAFGDMCIIKAPALLGLIEQERGEVCKVKEDEPHICELISMCERIKGDVWVSPYIVYPATLSLEGSLYDKPSCFIPRDAGFFSVFNFFMGSLMTGCRMYPYFNKGVFDKVNGGQNKHFCYWPQQSIMDPLHNAWFDYFEPVSFYHGDMEHESRTFLEYKVSQGEVAGGEFRIPSVYHKLTCYPELMQSWRHAVHTVFKKRIRIKRDIVDEVDRFWGETTAPVIGVHYRHPSHYVENGCILLKDYTEKIDAILKEHPSARIFLATDNEFGEIMFKHIYNTHAYKSMYGVDRVTFLPGIDRVDVDNILEWAYAKATATTSSDNMDFIGGKGYQLHYTKCAEGTNTSYDGGKIGKDVLKEVLCLSKCDWIIHTTSNVALAASYFNPNNRMFIIRK